MRVFLPVVLLMVSLLLIAGVVLIWAGASEALRARRPARVGSGWGKRAWNAAHRWLAKREARVHARVLWTHYSETDPLTGERLIGIMRAYRGVVLNRVEMRRVPAGDYEGCLEWEAAAMVRAVECNNNQSSRA